MPIEEAALRHNVLISSKLARFVIFLHLFLIIMSILFWNICGVGNVGTLSHLKYLIKHHQIKLVGLVEPKINGENADRQCQKLGFDGYHRVEAAGMSGVSGYYGRSSFILLPCARINLNLSMQRSSIPIGIHGFLR